MAFTGVQNNSEQMAHSEAPTQPDNWMAAWKVSNFVGKSSTTVPVPRRSVLDEHIFQLNSSYCNSYWDSCKVLLPDETKPSHGVTQYVTSSNVNSYFGATIVTDS